MQITIDLSNHILDVKDDDPESDLIIQLMTSLHAVAYFPDDGMSFTFLMSGEYDPVLTTIINDDTSTQIKSWTYEGHFGSRFKLENNEHGEYFTTELNKWLKELGW